MLTNDIPGLCHKSCICNVAKSINNTKLLHKCTIVIIVSESYIILVIQLINVIAFSYAKCNLCGKCDIYIYLAIAICHIFVAASTTNITIGLQAVDI